LGTGGDSRTKSVAICQRCSKSQGGERSKASLARGGGKKETTSGKPKTNCVGKEVTKRGWEKNGTRVGWAEKKRGRGSRKKKAGKKRVSKEKKTSQTKRQWKKRTKMTKVKWERGETGFGKKER